MHKSDQNKQENKSVRSNSAVHALVIFCISFLLTLILTCGMWALSGVQIGSVAIALIQGVIAAVISRWRCLPPWWIFIQFLFPSALMVMQSLHLPSTLYLIIFLFLLGLYWTTFRTQVPFYPSGPEVWKAVEKLLPSDHSVRFIDIGSGLGDLILNLAKCRPDSHFTGIEVAPLPWFASFLRSRIGHHQNKSYFIRGDYHSLNFAHYDVVFAYLSPAAMPALWDKARKEMRAGTLLLSYEFFVPGIPSHIETSFNSGGPALYGWCM